MGYTKNSILIKEDIDKVFDLTNDIANWKNLFSEYQESTVLEINGNKIKFRLTTIPEGVDGHQHSWVSERIVNKEKYECNAIRLEPTHPFEFMKIHWQYKSTDKGTEMTWIQSFKPAKGIKWNDQQFEDYLNKNSKIQMEVIKAKIENGQYSDGGY